MLALSSAIAARTPSEIAIAFDPGAWKIGTATADLLSSSERKAYSEAPSSMRATSRSRVTCPFAPDLTTISPNSSSLDTPRRTPAPGPLRRAPPPPHGVAARAEELPLPDAVDARQPILDVKHRVVA